MRSKIVAVLGCGVIGSSWIEAFVSKGHVVRAWMLIVAAYRGQSVILFAPIAALLAVLFTDAAATPAVFSELFMGRLTSAPRHGRRLFSVA